LFYIYGIESLNNSIGLYLKVDIDEELHPPYQFLGVTLSVYASKVRTIMP